MTDLFNTGFIDWIATTLGIRIRDSDRTLIWQRILTRVKVLGLPSAEAYHRFLAIKSQSIAWEAEWRELVNLLTVTESYFFRDQGQFGLLRHRIVAELIQRQRQACESTPYHRPQLRVWSAGCSTGEEAYSLAILLKELIPDNSAWDIRVLGTDVNGAALERAKRGLYNDW
ncbi:MAG TPA: CheR family methyltransferase, partial [Allocoleopsis sp.]